MVHAHGTECERKGGGQEHHDGEHGQVRRIIQPQTESQSGPQQPADDPDGIRTGEDPDQRPEGQRAQWSGEDVEHGQGRGHVTQRDHAGSQPHQQPRRGGAGMPADMPNTHGVVAERSS